MRIALWTVVLTLLIQACAPASAPSTAPTPAPTAPPAPKPQAAASPSPAAAASPQASPAAAGKPAAAAPAGFDEQAVASFYRNNTVKIVVGFSPGGGYDLYARLV